MKENLLGMSLQEMEKFFISMDEKTYRAKQVFQWIHQKGVSDFCEMTNLSKSLQAALDKKADARCLTRGSVYREFRAGLGAYYSSGSRKGMPPHQWAYARVNSAQPSKDWAKVKKRKKCPKKKRGKK